MEIQTAQPAESSPLARVEIPRVWLLPGLALEEIRAAQRDDTTVRFVADALIIQGVEFAVARHWIREPFWSRVGGAAIAGYVYRRNLIEVIFRPDRRMRMRPAGPLAAQMQLGPS